MSQPLLGIFVMNAPFGREEITPSFSLKGKLQLLSLEEGAKGEINVGFISLRYLGYFGTAIFKGKKSSIYSFTQTFQSRLGLTDVEYTFCADILMLITE